VWGDMVDVITCAIFGDCRLRGVGVVRGASLPSAIDLTRRPYNTGHSVISITKRPLPALRGNATQRWDRARKDNARTGRSWQPSHISPSRRTSNNLPTKSYCTIHHLSMASVPNHRITV